MTKKFRSSHPAIVRKGIIEDGLSAKEAFQIITQQLNANADPVLNPGTFSTVLMEPEAKDLL